MTTTFQQQSASYARSAQTYIDMLGAALNAREQRDAAITTRRQIEADFAAMDWEGSNQKVRDGLMAQALAENTAYQDVLASIRAHEHDMNVAEIRAEEAKLAMRLALLSMEHENAIASDVRIFDERFRGDTSNEHGNAVPR